MTDFKYMQDLCHHASDSKQNDDLLVFQIFLTQIQYLQ